jgi:hypothetical protein
MFRIVGLAPWEESGAYVFSLPTCLQANAQAESQDLLCVQQQGFDSEAIRELGRPRRR